MTLLLGEAFKVMPCDPNTLLDSAKCIESCLVSGQLEAIETNLLCIIAEGGGGMHFRILAETGDFLNTELGDRLRTE